MKQILRYFFVFMIIILLGGMIFFSNFSLRYRTYKQCKEIKELELNAVVDSTYFSVKGSYVIKIQNKKLINLYINEDPRYFLNQGDSIYKQKGSFKYTIYKENSDSVFVLTNKLSCKDYAKKIVRK